MDEPKSAECQKTLLNAALAFDATVSLLAYCLISPLIRVSLGMN